ncbi:hypothetical protein EVAR_56243_1 [Eumeta japonica]|uniref:Uncharacterized protein n=1 Tax=Eumeta variegata TaxID=151549 RepID=A0A4C1XKI4_EUMVA|nr:hypothetical protein EVAR_56243_1 [Eumeta japonica]
MLTAKVSCLFILFDATRLTLAGRIATGAVSHIGGSEGFPIGCRSRHNFLQNIGRCFLPYKVMNLFPGRVLGKCRVQPEPVARSLTHRLLFHLTIRDDYHTSAVEGRHDNLAAYLNEQHPTITAVSFRSESESSGDTLPGYLIYIRYPFLF